MNSFRLMKKSVIFGLGCVRACVRRVCVCARARVCVRACVHACVRVCV